MKKAIAIALIALFLVPAFAFSQEQSEVAATGTDEAVTAQKGAAKHSTKEGMRGKYAKTGMMEFMMKKQMVATSDGGVIVMSANKLLKYDKNLNLVKEVQIKMDFESMKEMMDEMKAKCPMHEQMMQEEKGKPATEEDKE